MDKKELKKAAKDIQAYCISRDDCDGCIFNLTKCPRPSAINPFKAVGAYKTCYCMFCGIFGEGDAPTDWDTKAIK
ncbi:hypothetical protein [Butyrivibrio virus Bo-Finn]|nr:hypothetical protein [Butyrivibrio virus Bo-Finn]